MHSNYSTYEELELLNSNWQIVLTIVYSLTALISLLGNVITIVVLLTGTERPNSKELQLLLVNLSLADITMALFSIPFTYTHFMLGRWIFMPEFCPAVQLMQITSVFVSVYTLTAIGIDRYIAIMHPFLSTQLSHTFGLLTIALIWLLGFSLGFVQWTKTQAIPFYISDQLNYDCKEVWSRDQSQWFTLSIFLITFALPMCVLMFVYGSVSRKLYRHNVPGNAHSHRDKSQQKCKIKIVKMLATIVVLFALCWLPLHVLNLIINFAHDWVESLYNTTLGLKLYVTIVITAHWLSMANSFVNPIIYCFMCEHFRTDLHVFYRKCLKRCHCQTNNNEFTQQKQRLRTQSQSISKRTNTISSCNCVISLHL